MRLFIGIIIGLLLLTSNAYAIIYSKGGVKIETGNVLEPGPDVIENDIAPVNPSIGTIWRDITDGTIYTWNGTTWLVRATSQDIKDEIVIFKTNIVNVQDPAVRKCLKSLGRIILKLYKESAE